MYDLGDKLFDEYLSDWYKMKEIITDQGYSSVKDWIEENECKREYLAKLSFYRARLARIRQLVEVDI